MIPLTAHTCLVIGDRGGRMIDRIVDQKAIREIDIMSAVNSYQFLIASAKPFPERIFQITKVNQWGKIEIVHVI